MGEDTTSTKDKDKVNKLPIPTNSSASLVVGRTADSAPQLSLNASGSSIDISSKMSLPDTKKSNKHHHKPKALHNDFPEIRAYYAK
jgi:hypothetical protein